MSGAVTAGTGVSLGGPAGAMHGFCGKLPARGDFVRVGLPRDFTDPWDAWLDSMMAGSRFAAGEAWLPAFLEAPIWRFILGAGVCGPRVAAGLTMPSVDKAGRYFPLTFATVLESPRFDPASLSAWLDLCEALGLAAIDQAMTPEDIRDGLVDPSPRFVETDVSASEWWSAGSTQIAPRRVFLDGMPELSEFMAMFGMPPHGVVSGSGA